MRSQTISDMNPIASEVRLIIVANTDGTWRAEARGAACSASSVAATADLAASQAVIALMRAVRLAGRLGVFLP